MDEKKIMKYLVYLLMALPLFGSDFNVDFYTILHAERETTLGKDSNNSYPKESNSFVTSYSSLSSFYDLTDNIFVVAACKMNYVLGEDTYKTPFYLRSKLTSDEIDKIIVSDLSLNYSDSFFSVNLGRSNVDFDWIDGSVDGVVAMLGSDESYALRLFWFNNFTQLQYNYYVEFNDINDKAGMYGAITTLKYKPVELNIYDYYMKDLRNIIGTSVKFTTDYFSFDIRYTTAKALDLALYDYDETFTNISMEYLYKRHSFELGGSYTGENGLLAMVQLGSFMFGEFYLSNQVDRESAKNAFAHYSYTTSSYKVELLGGYTNYDNSFVSLVNDLNSFEVDAYVTYAYSKHFMFDIGVMGMRVDERDPISISQTLVTTNLVYKYESF